MDQMENAQDRVTGDYSRFWRERDYTDRADEVKASIFITHGLEDWNVKTTHFAQWWDALGRAGVERRLWLHPGGHGRSQLEAWRDAVHRWIDHYLYGVRNGAQREPAATVERAGGVTESYRSWPDPAARPVSLPLAFGGRDSFVDNGATVRAEQLIVDPDAENPNRLAYVTPGLVTPARLSGTPTVHLRASVDNRTAANLTAVLVDYGPDGAKPKIVTRGWTDVQNRAGRPRPVQPGRVYDFHWDQEPKDHVFAAGHRIGLVILSTDHDYTLRPKPGTELTVRPGQSRIVLPIVGRLRF
jgi:X-Pro dipeptidyl-peptidase